MNGKQYDRVCTDGGNRHRPGFPKIRWRLLGFPIPGHPKASDGCLAPYPNRPRHHPSPWLLAEIKSRNGFVQQLSEEFP